MASYEEDLFWKTTHGPTLKGKEAVAASTAYESPEQTGQRLVELVRGWLTHALENLPEKLPGPLPENYRNCRAWFRVNLDPPGFSDPKTPHLALSELQYLTKNMPDAVPDGWELDRGQRLAVQILANTRDTIRATYGTEMDQAGKVLVLLENAVRLGSTAAQAHVEPWEPVAWTGLGIRDGGDRGRQTRERDAAPMHQQWRDRAAQLLEANPRLSKSALATKIADEWNQKKSNPMRSAGTIRNVI